MEPEFKAIDSMQDDSMIITVYISFAPWCIGGAWLTSSTEKHFQSYKSTLILEGTLTYI